ncbi:MAG: Unknown protein [uncultured Sulfurovum sp.]|uniref:Uncharacterized protein n=1 Tax=uncultured Sulfurovum sp. TaxID=269237 RepID=A0A6S6T1I8_9BACT|nr:MAG: Unknown protein [uncultured Sulfurovum sp.]
MIKRLLSSIVKPTLIFLLPFYLQAYSQKFAPIMIGGEITTFIPYTKGVDIELGNNITTSEGTDKILSGNVENPEDVASYEWRVDGVLVGTNEYFSTAGIGVGSHTVSLSVIARNGTVSTDSMRVVVSAESIDESNEVYNGGFVGTTKGAFSVTQGSAMYNLKIDVPPGVAGMEPKLSLSYNANAGNGIVGMGWNLGGVSAITRCAPNPGSDGTYHKHGVKYNSDDKFCLDGKRLILTSSDKSYGEADSEYRTEIDTYSKVMARGNENGGPGYFDVYTKSGLHYVYGNDNNSFVHTTSGHAYKAWKVNKIYDSYDNAITFTYTANIDAGTHQLTTVEYADNVVSYIYEDRSDILRGYHEGYTTAIRQRLKHVVVTTDHTNTEIRRYTLDYTSENRGSRRSTLQSITEVVSQEDVKIDLATLSFTYESTTGNLTSSNKSPKTQAEDAHYVDLDSDGCMDVYDNDRVAYGDCSGNFSIFYSVPTTTSNRYVHFGDFNGDGLLDILDTRLNNPKIIYNNGSRSFASATAYTDWHSVTPSNVKYYVSDFNGDGYSDVLVAEKSNYYDDWQEHIVIDKLSILHGKSNKTFLKATVMVNPPGEPDDIKIADFNGDGLTDLYFVVSGNDKIYLHRSSGYYFDYASSPAIIGAEENIKVADFNGDGASDVYVVQSGNDAIWMNEGNGTLTTYSAPEIIGDTNDIKLADINGDGYTDLYKVESNSDKIWLNNGQGSLAYAYSIAATGGASDIHFSDLNGDGMTDMIDTGSSDKIWFNAAKHPRLTYINNNADQEIDIVYKKMVDSSVYYNYSKNGNRNVHDFNKISHGNIELTPAQYVVQSVSSDNGIGGSNTIEYKYYGYVYNKERGAQGFHRVRSCSDATNQCSLEVLRQIGMRPYTNTDDVEGFQFTGMPYAVYHGIPDSHSYLEDAYPTRWLSRTTIEYADASTRAKIYEPYTYSNTQSISDPLASSSTPIKVVSHRNSLSDNGLGNILETKEIIEDKENSKTYTKITTNTYDDDTQKWHLGRLDTSEVEHQVTGKTTIIKKSEFEYNDYGLLSKEVANSHSSTLKLTKTYTYDDYGNKETETIKGSGVTEATTTYGYDNLGKFQTSITNALKHTIHKTYNARFGTLESLTDVNGLITTWKYDGLGRKIQETLPDGSITTWSHEWENGSSEIGAPYTLYSVSQSSKTQPFTRTYYDSLGREVGAYTYTLAKGSRISLDDRRIQTRKYYNAKGELTHETLPRYSNQSTKYITTSHDDYGRVSSVSKTSASGDTATYTSRYNNFTTTVTSPATEKYPNGIQKQTIKNAIDQVTSITDAFGRSDASTISYTYDATGNLLSTTDSGGNVIRMEYDDAGNKDKMIDPDLGTWTYGYNALGKMTSQSNALSQNTIIAYDVLGRIADRNVSQGVSKHNTAYKYGTSGNSKGKLYQTISISKQGSQAEKKQTVTTTYDSLGRATQSSATQGGKTFTTKTTYDSYSRPSTLTYPNGYSITNHYKNAILDSVIGGDGKRHYDVEGMNAYGDISDATFANRVRTVIGHNDAGFIGSIHSGQNAQWNTGNVQQLHYTYNTLGSVLTRNDSSITNRYINETFTYDAHNRLYSLRTSSNVAESYTKNKDYRYDKLGNMTYQTGVGTYNYTDTRYGPHAVNSAGSRTYKYDTVGNMTDRNGDSITYNPLNKPSSMRKSGASSNQTVHFTYGAGGQRYLKQVGTKTTHYVGKAYEEQVNGNETKQIAYITLGGKTIGTHTEVKSTYYDATDPRYHANRYNRYFHTDALGSITSVTNDAGTVVERRSIAPFGKIRAMNYGTNNNTIANTTLQTTRAFTGHEQIGELNGLIHMNARVYDSDIGRFLSADTIIQDPHDSQSYNRYSYVRNNPLMYTDPTGHSWFSKVWDKIGTYVTAIVVAVVAIATGGAALMAMTGASTAVGAAGLATFGQIVVAGTVGGFAAGVTGGLLSGANLVDSVGMGAEGALYGGLSAGVANGIGTLATSWGRAKALLHGITRAAISKAQGGKWSAGFWSGFASSALAPTIASAETFSGKVTISAIVGGTASELGGGKFANGAVTGAFVFMYNDMAHARQKALHLSTDKLIASFEKMRSLPLAKRLMLLYKFTKNGSLLDFKQEGKEYQDYGNFAFGAVGSSLDIDDAILLRGAGWAQTRAGTSKSNYGTPYGFSPYGDDPRDQKYIKYGINYYRNQYGK